MIESDRALVDRFLDMMAAEAGASPHTLAAYRNDLEKSAADLDGGLGMAGREALETLGQPQPALAGAGGIDSGAPSLGASPLLPIPRR